MEEARPFDIFAQLCLQKAITARPSLWLRLANFTADASLEARAGRIPVLPFFGLPWSGPAPGHGRYDPDALNAGWVAFAEGIACGRKGFSGSDNAWLGAFWACLCSLPNPEAWLRTRSAARLRLFEIEFEISSLALMTSVDAHRSEDGLAEGLSLGLSMARDPARAFGLLSPQARALCAPRQDWRGWTMGWRAGMADRVRTEALRPFLPGSGASCVELSWRLSRLSALSACLPQDEESAQACAGGLSDSAMLAWLAPVDRAGARAWRQACLLAFPLGVGDLASELSLRGALGAAQALGTPFEETEADLLGRMLIFPAPARENQTSGRL